MKYSCPDQVPTYMPIISNVFITDYIHTGVAPRELTQRSLTFLSPISSRRYGEPRKLCFKIDESVIENERMTLFAAQNVPTGAMLVLFSLR